MPVDFYGPGIERAHITSACIPLTRAQYNATATTATATTTLPHLLDAECARTQSTQASASQHPPHTLDG